jgi:hypothetical protein
MMTTPLLTQHTIDRILRQRPDLKEKFSREYIERVFHQYRWDLKHDIFPVDYLAEVLLLSATVFDIALHEKIGEKEGGWTVTASGESLPSYKSKNKSQARI